MKASTDRMAWTQHRTSEGMGSGLEAFKDRQAKSRTHAPMVKNYYESEEYKQTLDIEGMEL